MRIQHALSHLADSTVVRELRARATFDRTNTAELLVYIMEFDSRRLYLPAGYPSTFAYCVGELRLSEDATAKRIHAGRAARRFPVLFELLASGELTLTALNLLAPHLRSDNARELIEAARHKNNREITEMLARRFPRPDLPELVRPLEPARLHLSSQHAVPHVGALNSLPERALEFAIQHQAPIPARATPPDDAPVKPPVEERAKTMPLSADRFGLQLTIDRETHELLRRAQELLSHSVRQGDLATVIRQALKQMVEKLEKQKFAASAKPRRVSVRTDKPGNRNPRTIPASIKRAVWQRDHGQCTFAGASGHRCDCRRQLEFDHIVPIARGGMSSASNLRLRCRAHNQYEAERVFGAGFMQEKREAARSATAPTAAHAVGTP